MARKKAIVIALIALLYTVGQAKDQPGQVIVWPETGKPVLRFTFGKFKETGGGGGHHVYNSDTTAENLWDKKIPLANFSLYLYDKNKVRVGEGYVSVSNIGPGEVVKFQTIVDSAGTPASMTLVAQSLPAELQSKAPRSISITVNSVPQGAMLKVDGADAGATPKVIHVTPGKHSLEFSKEGFNSGAFPLDLAPDEPSGGSVSYELGASAHDTIELRDGSVLVGDVESVTPTEVVVRIGGALQHLNRNQVKRILLVERDAPVPAKAPGM
ncbi:MAG TPA: PEGA domain-containing protein [Candidatus Angelobacter sp.]|nr:PEGA domain-containing protein [Candidatus Angelobacter sp.]